MILNRFHCSIFAVLILLLCGTGFAETKEAFILSSSAFSGGGFIDLEYAGMGVKGGSNISFPLSWKGVPKSAKSLALSMMDKSAGDFIHWYVINLPTDIDHLSGEASPMNMPYSCAELRNGFGTIGYAGPDPAPGSGAHEYEITLYALSTRIDVSGNKSFDDLKNAVENNIIEKASLTGKFISPAPADNYYR